MEILSTAFFWAAVFIVASFTIAILWAIWENKPLMKVIWGVAGFFGSIGMIILGLWLASTIH